MKEIFAVVCLWALLAFPVKANEEVQDVISAQIAAFLQDDFATAFTFASPMIRGIFGTPERFGQMVRNGYPMVWRPSEVEFLSTEERGDTLVQNVLVRDADGAQFVLEYEMIETGGGWLINGVRVRKAGDGLT